MLSHSTHSHLSPLSHIDSSNVDSWKLMINMNPLSYYNKQGETDETFKPVLLPSDLVFRPVMGLITLVLIILYWQWPDLNVCGHSWGMLSLQHFFHVDVWHLMSNIVALVPLSIVEDEFGSTVTGKLLVWLWFINVVIDKIIHTMFKLECTIGFSSILFGLYTWMLFYDRDNITFVTPLVLFLRLLFPSVVNAQASLVGHVTGICSGLILAFWFHPPSLFHICQQHQANES